MNPPRLIPSDPWAQPTPDEQALMRRLPTPRHWPPPNPGPIVGDTMSVEQSRQIKDFEAWRDRDLP